MPSKDSTLNRRHLLQLLSAALPAAGLLGACSDAATPVADTGAGAADQGPWPDASRPPDSGAPDLGADQGSGLDAALPDATPPKCESTAADALGPFHVKGAPYRAVLTDASEPGDRVQVTGVVYGPDCKTPLSGANLDIWHADASGNYHTSTTQYRLRGQVKTDAKGRYQFDTIRPGQYSNRPRHYHLIVAAAGHQPITTQIYFKGDPLLGPKDSCQPPTCNSGDPGRVVTFTKGTSGGKLLYQGSFDVVLKTM